MPAPYACNPTAGHLPSPITGLRACLDVGMKFKDLREFVAFLEGKGDLRRVATPVTCELEISEIADRVVKRGGPALLFENVTGYDVPVLINMYGTEQRMAWALGVDHLDDVVKRIQDLLQLVHGPPEGLVNKLRTLGQLIHLGSFQPKTQGRRAPGRARAARRLLGRSRAE